MFAQLIAEKVGAPSNRRGARGFRQHFPRGFEGLADGPLGIPGVYAYTLANGHVVYLPEDWNSLSSIQKLLWIQSSDLSSQDSIQLETEAGIQDPAIGPDPFLNLPPAGTTGVPIGTVNASGGRPYNDYVKAGDVVRVTVPFAAGLAPETGALLQGVASRLPSYLIYIGGTLPGWLGGSFTVDVQSGIDRAHLSDIAGDVQAIAGQVDAGAARTSVSSVATAAFVSQVEQTGGVLRVPATPPPPGSKNPLGLSNTNLLLIGGAGVLLLVVLAKK